LEPVRAYVAPAQRAAALERARSRLESLESTMSVVLAQPAHPLFADVATAVADLRLVDLEPALRSSLTIARGDALAVAWIAVDNLQPIEEAEVAALMDASERPLQQAGLRIAKSRTPLPESLVGAALACVRNSDPGLRMLAISCLPEQLDAAHTDAVLDLCDENPTDAGVAALLGRVPPSERGLEALMSRVQGADAQTVLRLQPAIRRYANMESVRKALWDAAADLDDVERLPAGAAVAAGGQQFVDGQAELALRGRQQQAKPLAIGDAARGEFGAQCHGFGVFLGGLGDLGAHLRQLHARGRQLGGLATDFGAHPRQLVDAVGEHLARFVEAALVLFVRRQ